MRIAQILVVIAFTYASIQTVNAQTWHAVEQLEGGLAANKLVDFFSGLVQTRTSIRDVDGKLFVVGSRRLFASTDKGKSWYYSGTGLGVGPYECALRGKTIFLSVCRNGTECIWKSTDQGASWREPKLEGLPQFSGIRTVFDIAASDSSLFALVRNNVNTRGSIVLCRSDDDGDTWRQVAVVSAQAMQSDDEMYPRPSLLCEHNNVVWNIDALSAQASHDNANSFVSIGGIGNIDFTTRQIVLANQVYMVSNQQRFKLFRYDLTTTNPTPQRVVVADSGEYVTGLSLSRGCILARVFIPSLPSDSSLAMMMSIDSGRSWKRLPMRGLNRDFFANMPLTLDLATMLVLSDREIMRSEDSTKSFSMSQSGYRAFGGLASFVAQCGTALCVSDYESLGFASSLDAANSWQFDFAGLKKHSKKSLSELPIRSYATSRGIVSFDSAQIRITVDGARTWNPLDQSAIETHGYQYFSPLDYDGHTLYFRAQYDTSGTKFFRYYKMDDSLKISGWSFVNPNGAGENMMVVRGDTILCFNPQISIKYTTDRGQHWTDLEFADTSLKVTYYFSGAGGVSAAGNQMFVACALKKSGVDYIGTPICHVRDSKLELIEALANKGFGTQLNDILNFKNSSFVLDTSIYFALSDGMYQSMDKGTTFTKAQAQGFLYDVPFVSVAKVANRVYALTDGVGLFYYDTETSDVSDDSSPSNASKLYPQPVGAGQQLHIKGLFSASSIRMTSVLGQSMDLSWLSESDGIAVVIPQLQAGLYTVLVADKDDNKHRFTVIVGSR